VDVLTAVVPYVPSEELRLLPRDVLRHEPPRALDGGTKGMAVLARAAHAASRLLRPGGTALLEIGGEQARELEGTFAALGMDAVRIHRDEDGLDRVVEARRR
jgi:release factor glutamine methyltransferase